MGPALAADETEGYATLLGLVYDELAQELPGLYGDVGLTGLVPVPPATLRAVVEALNDPDLESCWTDDTTLGWVYQYWNDPEREALDAKLNAGGKVEPHEIASKTQMFTERYIVEWLLQNSLGQMWLAMCEKHGWTPDARAQGVLDRLEERRKDWRERRELRQRELAALRERQARGEDLDVPEDRLPGVALDELMPIEGELEEHWKYWVPQPMPPDAVEKAPDSVWRLKLLDPAAGSGHFLVIAFDLLAAMYREEARYRAGGERRAECSEGPAEREPAASGRKRGLPGVPSSPALLPHAGEGSPEVGTAEGDGHRGGPGGNPTDREIAESIVENNLYGVDLDPRAVQIAAAALYLKARSFCPEARPGHMNLVASDLRLASLQAEDPALDELRKEVREKTGIPERLTDQIVKALEGADHFGTLLRVDAAVDEAIGAYEQSAEYRQYELFVSGPQNGKLDMAEAKTSLLERLEGFLEKVTGGQDIGLRLRGEQLAAGVRFIRIVKENEYDLVVGNPPYQGTSRMADAGYVQKQYPRAKADLYAAFLERGLQLAREGGVSALLTMRNWMFIQQYAKLREHLLKTYDLRVIGDLDRGAFDEVPNDILAVGISVVQKRASNSAIGSVALQPTARDDQSFDRQRTQRKRSAVLAHEGKYQFRALSYSEILQFPIVYWWTEEFINYYVTAPKLATVAPARNGLSTQNNTRFLRLFWEVGPDQVFVSRIVPGDEPATRWVPYIKGAAGREWQEDLRDILLWHHHGYEVKVFVEYHYGSYSRSITSETLYFKIGIAFSMIGHTFRARAHRFSSIFGHKGASIFPTDIANTLCTLNSVSSRSIMISLNPGLDFLVSDVDRLPVLPIEGSWRVWTALDAAFGEHEHAREASIEFHSPGSSPWQYAQAWAQRAVDRPAGEPLPPYEPVYEPARPENHVSFALGVALGRFGPDGEGILTPVADGLVPAYQPALSADEVSDARGRERRERTSEELRAASCERRAKPDPTLAGDGLEGSSEKLPAEPEQALASGPSTGSGQALRQAHGGRSGRTEDTTQTTPLIPYADVLPAGILFLSLASERDSLEHPACRRLIDAWGEHGPAIAPGTELRDWLAKSFFGDVHRPMYENRPIYFPLSSAKKSFVAYVSIHRWTEATLPALLADHLLPERRSLEGQLEDLRKARASTDRRSASAAEKQFARIQKLNEELSDFIEAVRECAEHGPPPPDSSTPARERNARYAPDLDDGVMINSSALWPLLEPQWKEPKKWWKELATAAKSKDYDWSHLAARYFPKRVDEKCKTDPSLAVAHGCFWRYHPERAYAWELRLQDEIRPDFTIDEEGSDEARSRFLREHKLEAAGIRDKEQKRRERKARKQSEVEEGVLEEATSMEGNEADVE